MFDAWNQWTWVAVAWIELVLAYGGYLAYLAWRRRRLVDELESGGGARAGGGGS